MSELSCRSSPSKVSKVYEHEEGDENCVVITMTMEARKAVTLVLEMPKRGVR
jgi:hypothetical protein